MLNSSLVFGITSSVVGINICAITAKIKKYKSIRKNKNDKIVLLGKDQLNTAEFLISKSLIDSNASVRKTNQHRLLPLSNCAISGKKKSTFIKNQGLHNFDNILNDQFKMNKIINNFFFFDQRQIYVRILSETA